MGGDRRPEGGSGWFQPAAADTPPPVGGRASWLERPDAHGRREPSAAPDFWDDHHDGAYDDHTAGHLDPYGDELTDHTGAYLDDGLDPHADYLDDRLDTHGRYVDDEYDGYVDDQAGYGGPNGNGHGIRYDDDRRVRGNGAGRPDHEFNGELDYDDYFDDDEDDLADVEATSNATRNALEWAVVLVGAVLVALLLRASLFQAFYIPTESMETTLLINDRVLVNKVSYRLHDIHRGDVIVFAREDPGPDEIRDLIKRVIALPGETIEARDNNIYIDGRLLVEPYLDEGVLTDDFGPTVVPEGEVFVMGDNRDDSFDSRWFGTVSEDRVIGRAFVLFWPVNRFGSL